MTDERSYPEGVPCWVDTEQPDVDAACHFYARLFGWTFSDAVPADAPGRYLIASLDGADVAAIGPTQGDTPVEWHTYIAAADADAAAASGRSAGGLRRSAGRTLPPVAATTAAGRPTHQRTRQLELQRPAHRRRVGSHRVLCAAVRLGVRRTRVRDDDPATRLW